MYQELIQHCKSTILQLDCEATIQFSLVQLLSRVWLFVTPWTAAHLASLSITNSWNLLKLMSLESVMPSNHFKWTWPFSCQSDSIRMYFSLTVGWYISHRWGEVQSMCLPRNINLCTPTLSALLILSHKMLKFICTEATELQGLCCC